MMITIIHLFHLDGGKKNLNGGITENGQDVTGPSRIEYYQSSKLDWTK